MPSVLLPVPHFEQSRDGNCLPACVQMVLAFWGDEQTEAALTKQLGTKQYGTPIRNAQRLREKGYEVTVVWDAFLAAWAEYDETAVVIAKA